MKYLVIKIEEVVISEHDGRKSARDYKKILDREVYKDTKFKVIKKEKENG